MPLHLADVIILWKWSSHFHDWWYPETRISKPFYQPRSPGICQHRHDDVIKWKHFPRNWPFVRGIHRSPVNSPHKGQWRWALIFSLICARINGWVNNGVAGDLRRYRAHYDVIVMGIRKFMVMLGRRWANICFETCHDLLKLLTYSVHVMVVAWVIKSR